MTQAQGDNAAEDAVSCYDRAMAAYRQGDFAAAMRACDAGLKAEPEHADLLHLISALYLSAGDAGRALAAAERARDLQPDSRAIQNGYAIALHGAGRSAEAVQVLTSLANQSPQAAEPRVNLAMIYLDSGAWDEALDAAAAALEIEPDNAAALSNAASVYQRLGLVEQAAELLRSALQRQPDHPDLLRNLLTVIHYDPNATHQEIAEMTRRYWSVRPRPPAPEKPTGGEFGGKAAGQGPVHIGFLSPDFRSHPVGHFLLPVVTGLDPATFQVSLYANQTEEDDVTHTLKRHASNWVPVKGVPDAAVAARIASDGVDLLIDLAGLSDGHRLDVMRLKPAPVQASWFGYVATTGLPEVDYMIADKHVWPLEDDHYFVERPVRLPNTYFCFEPPEIRVPVGPPPSASRGYITFGSLNNTVKLNSACLSVWADILKAVPDSKLLLKAPQLSDPRITARVVALCEASGIEQTRMVLLGRTSRKDHLAAYNQVDLILDPFPYGGGITTAEAVWMGVPVVTLNGERWVARAGVSILSTAGLPQFIAADLAAYREQAIALAGNPNELASLRLSLRSVIESSPLCNRRRYVRDVEAALMQMVGRAP